MATRKRDFHVRYFKGAKDNGSKCDLFNKSQMRGSSHSGGNSVVGGLELKILISTEQYEDVILLTGCSTYDNLER